MEYKKLIERLKKETYWVGGSHPYSHDVHPLICDEAADAITALLARAEAAESRCEILEKAIKELSNIAIPGDQRIEDGAEQVVMFCGVPFEEAIKRVLEFPKMKERAEAAEKELTECKEKNAGLALALLTEQPPNADCLGDLEWEKIRSRFKAEEERAKKAERERDAAVKDIPRNCHTCLHRSEPECGGNKNYHDFGYRENCEYWMCRGQKEE